MQNLDLWILGDSRRGQQAQYEALAEGLNITPKIIDFQLPFPWKDLPPALCFKPLCVVRPPLTPPWPDMLISISRVSTALAAEIRKKSQGKTFAIHIQKPQLSIDKFDLIVAPEHDELKGDNVISTLGSLHNISPTVLASAALEFQSQYSDLALPVIGVLLGGNSKHGEFTHTDADRLIHHLKSAQDKFGGTLFIVPSRRTPPEVIMQMKVAFQGRAFYIWEGERLNPYRGILASAHILITTGDSVNMNTEVAASGKPAFVFHFGKVVKKFTTFFDRMKTLNLVKPLTDDMMLWKPEPLFELPRVVAEIHKRYQEHIKVRNENDA